MYEAGLKGDKKGKFLSEMDEADHKSLHIFDELLK